MKLIEADKERFKELKNNIIPQTEEEKLELKKVEDAI